MPFFRKMGRAEDHRIKKKADLVRQISNFFSYVHSTFSEDKKAKRYAIWKEEKDQHGVMEVNIVKALYRCV